MRDVAYQNVYNAVCVLCAANMCTYTVHACECIHIPRDAIATPPLTTIMLSNVLIVNDSVPMEHPTKNTATGISAWLLGGEYVVGVCGGGK